MSQPPKRILRRLITDLARSAPEDIEAVLGALDTGEREAVSQLMAVYAEESPELPPTLTVAYEPASEPWSPEFSSWLMARVDGRDAALQVVEQPLALRDGDSNAILERAPFFITATAAEALRQAADATRPKRAPLKAPPPRRPRTMFSRLQSLAGGKVWP